MRSHLLQPCLFALVLSIAGLPGCTSDSSNEASEENETEGRKKKKKKESQKKKERKAANDDDEKEEEEQEGSQAETAAPLKGGGELMKTLRTEFKKNHRAAKTKYAGRKATLTGFVSMKISENFRFNERGVAKQGTADILCRVNDQAVVDGLDQKDKVTIEGTITGTAYDIDGGNIEMKPCKVTKATK